MSCRWANCCFKRSRWRAHINFQSLCSEKLRPQRNHNPQCLPSLSSWHACHDWTNKTAYGIWALRSAALQSDQPQQDAGQASVWLLFARNNIDQLVMKLLAAICPRLCLPSGKGQKQGPRSPAKKLLNRKFTCFCSSESLVITRIADELQKFEEHLDGMLSVSPLRSQTVHLWIISELRFQFKQWSTVVQAMKNM